MNETPVTPAPTDPTRVFTTFTNSAGQKFMIHGLSPMLPNQITETLQAEWKESGRTLPVPPTYEVTTVSGEKEVHQHDEKSILTGTPEQVAEQQAQYGEYSRNNAEFQGEYSVRLMRKVFLAVVTPPTDDWRAEMEFVGVRLPPKGSPQERYKFVELEVIQSLDDIGALQVAVFRLAGIIDQKGEEAAKASFRSNIEAAIAQSTLPKAPAGDVESKPVLLGRGDGSLLESAPVRTGTVRPGR
jgi:hypothetical protein